MKEPSYTLTQDTISLVWEGKSHIVRKGAPNFLALKKAIHDEDWAAIPNHLTTVKSLETWAKGKFTLKNERFYYSGEVIPASLNQRIISMATTNEDPSKLLLFWEKLQKNPSKRSVDQLFPFLQHQGIPFTDDGCFLAYKSVRPDFKDHHSGEFDNSPGKILEMPRNKISDDPREACHEGFHVGARSYAASFNSGGILLICKIDPADVVCVPYDSSQQKMRVCKYEVIGHDNGQHMPSTTMKTPAKVKSTHKVPTVPSVDKSSKKKSKKSFAKYDNMDLAKLMDQSIGALRTYASQSLSIVGASKMPGGKTALVKRIIEVRKRS